MNLAQAPSLDVSIPARRRGRGFDRQTRERVATGRRRTWHRFERVNCDADGLNDLEGKPVDPDGTVRRDNGCHMNVLRLVAHVLTPSESVVYRDHSRPMLPAGDVAPQAFPDGAGQGGGVPSPALSSHFETGPPRLVAGLSGEWSRNGSLWIALTRVRSAVSGALRSVLDFF